MKRNLLLRLVGKRGAWGFPYLIFMILFVLLPLLLVVMYAFTNQEGHFTLENFGQFFSQSKDLNTFLYSLGIAIITTIICIVIGYPIAYILSNANLCKSQVMVMLFILPMWVNVLVRTLATVALFGFMDIPLGEGALIFGMVYNFLPFMILPIYNILKKLDKSYIEAAQDMGASPSKVFTKVIFPLSLPGVVSGIMMVFMPTISTFAISELLTMNKVKLFGTTIQENINNGLWNYGAVLALLMLVIILITTWVTDSNETTSENNTGGLI